MNRKLLVIAMVPLLVGLAGAMAFSQYQGTMQKTITVSTGVVKVSESVECVGAYILPGTYVVIQPYVSTGSGTPSKLTPVVIGGIGSGGDDRGQMMQCPMVTECHTGDTCRDPGAPSLIGDPIYFLSTTVSMAHLWLDVSYMAPGDWIELDLIDQAATCPSCLAATVTSSITPTPGLAGTVDHPGATLAPWVPSGTPLIPLKAASAGGWAWLKDPNTCRSDYVGPTAAPISVGTISHPIGLEYCASGNLAPTSPTATAGPVTIGSGIACTYLLIGFDHSADDSMMGVSGTLTEVVTAY